MKKRLFIVLLVFILFISSCKNNISEQNCEEKCGGNERCIILCENSEIIDRATDTNDLTVCEQLSGNAKDVCKDQVYIIRSVKVDNVELCNNIIEQDFKNKCFDSYYYRKATITKDKSHCIEIKNAETKSKCEAIK